MEITGKVHEIGAVQEVTATFKKRDLVIEYADNPQYPEFIKFEAHQDRVNLFDNLNSGDEISVSFNLRGRPWTNKEGVTTYFNSLVAWRVNKVAGTPTAQGGSAGNQGHVTPQPAVNINVEDGEPDDLPF